MIIKNYNKITKLNKLSSINNNESLNILLSTKLKDGWKDSAYLFRIFLRNINKKI